MPTIDDMINAPEQQIRAILLALCEDQKVRRHALEHYEALQAAASSETSLKRKAKDDLFVCVQCGEAFTNDENHKEACCYHWGELEPDYDSMRWADHDERCHGTIDSDEMREAYPDGFIWNCCDELGDTTGCTLGRHESHPDKSKKGTGEEPSESESDDDDDDDDEDEDAY
ncbi:hypothetical protein NM208_g13182 [Fusarium decemcellulare]|uniref:Uncharacterized protein n=1 Tax=Fusarium decemcellulare TaxID=57161 RepID=A0ACC1RLF5_9HYPO|nr:hypothetical protein NM208_g13182 [Fusarium decemcellulare]